MRYNIIAPFIHGFITFLLISMVLFVILVVVCIVVNVLRDSKQYQRKQILKDYRRAEAIMRRRVAASEETGVLYSKEKG